MERELWAAGAAIVGSVLPFVSFACMIRGYVTLAVVFFMLSILAWFYFIMFIG